MDSQLIIQAAVIQIAVGSYFFYKAIFTGWLYAKSETQYWWLWQVFHILLTFYTLFLVTAGLLIILVHYFGVIPTGG